MKLPAQNETTLTLHEYQRLSQTQEGRRIIIENANEVAQRRMEREERSHRKERR